MKDHSVYHKSLLGPRPWAEWSCEIGIVCPAVLPSDRKFSRYWFISFFWNLTWCFGPIYSCVWHGFFAKTPHQAKMTKNGQKWPKNRVFGIVKKFKSGIGVKRKFLWFIVILRKLHAWEKSDSQVIAKNGSRPVRFQYCLIVNFSLKDYDLTLIFGM